MISFMVPRGELLAALQSVLPHAGKCRHPKDWMGCLRFEGTGDGLWIYASDTSTLALARCPNASFSEELPRFDLEVNIARIIPQVFRPPAGKEARAEWLDSLLQINVAEAEVCFVDAAVLFEGESVTLPVCQVEVYPHIPTVLAAARGFDGGMGWSRPRYLHPSLIGRFMAAAKAYDAKCIAEQTGEALEVFVGSNFWGRALFRPVKKNNNPDSPDNGAAELRDHIDVITKWRDILPRTEDAETATEAIETASAGRDFAPDGEVSDDLA